MGEQADRQVKKLRAEGDALQNRLSQLTAVQWETPVYSEGQVWKARDVLAHLVAAERGHQRVIADVAHGGPGSPLEFDIDRYNRGAFEQLGSRSVEQLMADAAAARQETITLVAKLSDEELNRRGRHPVLGEDAALIDMIRIIFLHVKMHLRDLERVF